MTETDRIKELEAENKQLKDKLDRATEYAQNAIVGHNVSGYFVTGYTKTFGDKDEWVNIAYLKELFEILAKKESI